MSHVLPREHVDIAFLCILGRLPESDEIRSYYHNLADLDVIITKLMESPEAQRRLKTGPFWNFNSQIEAVKIIRSHESHDRRPVADRLVNFLGVIIDPVYLPEVLAGQSGKVEGLPLPANWHADIAEFAAALRAVDLAKDTFRVIELGCGWGCWLLNTGVAARQRGLDVKLIGAEGDDGHVKFAKRGCAENGFNVTEANIYRGIVGPKAGVALFPRQDTAGVSWGLEPIFDATEEQVKEAESGGRYDILPVLTLNALADGKIIDLVHIDIQGGEADFIYGCMDDLQRLVAYVVVGTHSRNIEGRIIDAMLKHGWVLEIERPAILNFDSDGRPYVSVDGVQGWRNPGLRPV